MPGWRIAGGLALAVSLSRTQKVTSILLLYRLPLRRPFLLSLVEALLWLHLNGTTFPRRLYLMSSSTCAKTIKLRKRLR